MFSYRAVEVGRFVEESKSDERKDWLAGMQKGVNEGNWLDLITHRTSHSTSRGRPAC